MPTLDSKQSEWLRKMRQVLDGQGSTSGRTKSPPVDPAAGTGGTAKAEGSKVAGADVAQSVFGLPIDPPDLTIRATIRIFNNSEHILKLVSGSAKLENPNGSEFDTDPPIDIAPNESPQIVVSNNFPFVTGVGGQVAYDVADDPAQTRVFIQWERGRVPDRSAIIRIIPEDRTRFTSSGTFQDDNFEFKFQSRGGGVGPVTPGGRDIASSCMVKVTNNTQAVLTLVDQGHERGDFMTFPASTLQPGATTEFVSIETPNAKDDGCEGFLVWQVGTPSQATWRVEWNNPEQEKNTTAVSLEPQTAGFSALDQIGQGEENVPVAFTISGGGPGPGPVIPPGSEVPFVPPPESKQPTLRKGDKSKDGWVEYLQSRLYSELGLSLPVDGVFNAAVHKAVIDFQTQRGLLVDGVVGNQTWAALRDDTPAPPSTDGREPHTFVEEGPEVRWDKEKGFAVYSVSDDELRIGASSVGDARIDDEFAIVRITPPKTKPTAKRFKIGPPDKERETGAGHLHSVKIPNFKNTFPATDPDAKMEEYLVEAYFEPHLGGDLYQDHIIVVE